jgi:hypothetical protein
MSTTKVSLQDTVEIFGVQSVLRLCRLVRLVRIIKARKYVNTFYKPKKINIFNNLMKSQLLRAGPQRVRKNTVGSCLFGCHRQAFRLKFMGELRLMATESN